MYYEETAFPISEDLLPCGEMFLMSILSGLKREMML